VVCFSRPTCHCLITAWDFLGHSTIKKRHLLIDAQYMTQDEFWDEWKLEWEREWAKKNAVSQPGSQAGLRE